MKINKYIYALMTMAALFGASSCKKDLDVKNPNSPTLEQTKTESGVISLASGGVYINGFVNGDGWLGDSYFSLPIGFHELLADNVSAEAANQNINIVNVPDYVILDDGSKISNTSPQKSNLRINNTRDKQSQNMFYYEWTNMYAMNNACNQVLALVDNLSFAGDAATRKSTIKAWAYWWKGFAYAKLGSVYYAGLVNNTVNGVNPVYVNSAALIAESNKDLDQAATLLSGISKTDDYKTVMAKLLPDFVQVGLGKVPTPAMFIHSINTLKARNILANKKLSDMTAADWSAILTLVNNGVNSGESVFTGRTNAANNNGFFSATGGTVASLASGLPSSTTFKISERLIQDFKTGDKRLSNNFKVNEYFNQVGGFTFSSRWQLLDAKQGSPNNGAVILANTTNAAYELYIASTYEENELMKAEALINTGQIEQGLGSIDNVRAYQGAGLAKVAGAGLSLADAKEELRKERRVALVFRGTAFYDARRWGVTDDVAKGGGRKNAVVLTSGGVLNTHATINYNFLDYWDVPADEFVLNPPAAGSAPIKNPN
ncbi:RagB/SusD family nutrient uptake outer membrane protein [Mucilaginibacter sp. OK283]|uniref:RagB/SusD family nutrient uptake outer membrane protein n=1 Tax=Mucilaginibacter sp. OK283 TaxID=1881049 RepID=UPI0008C45A06|nr:RagB/SusD family nutrient uptake outer membrane protein [Mucilaginibacter sp. OK283]SEP25813.1 SusD family protein [Mucilaginibacter sp. OK283]